jgi:hypothetical protein
MTDNPKLDEATVTMIGHLSIRDKDTGEVILRQRDKPFEKTTDEHDDDR